MSAFTTACSSSLGFQALLVLGTVLSELVWLTCMQTLGDNSYSEPQETENTESCYPLLRSKQGSGAKVMLGRHVSCKAAVLVTALSPVNLRLRGI